MGGTEGATHRDDASACLPVTVISRCAMPIGRHGAPVARSISHLRMFWKQILRRDCRHLTSRRYSVKRSRSLRFCSLGMSSYPFDRVWHHGRGVKFAKSIIDAVTPNSLGIPQSMHTTAREAGSPDNISKELGLDPEDSENDNLSFVTAPEEYDEEVGNHATDARTDNVSNAVTATDAALASQITLLGPPRTKLDYNVCEPAFKAAQRAPAGSTASYWSYTMYRGPVGEDGQARNVKVHYCTSNHTMERVSKYFVDEEVIGFDLEWFPQATKLSGPRKNCALVQIASASRIALFHLAIFPQKDDLVSPTFRRIMEDPDVSKVGVNIKGDFTRVRGFLGVGPRGAFELSHLYKLVEFSPSGRVDLINKRCVALGTQVQECLGLPLYKGSDVRASDWTKRLTIDQVKYAASDAYAGLQLYHVLDERRQALRPTPPRPYHAELNQPIRLAEVVASPIEDEIPVPVDGEVAPETEATAGNLARNPLRDPKLGTTVDAVDTEHVIGQA